MELIQQRQELRHQKEILTIEEEIKKREYKNRKLLQSRSNHEKLLEQNKLKLLTKIENNEERIKRQKYEQEQEKQKKYNKIYMMREDRKDRVIRNEKIKSFERKLKMDQINNRMEKIEEMKKERYLLDEQRKKMEAEINNRKSIMLNRLSQIIRSDEYYTRDEIIDYVFRNIFESKFKYLVISKVYLTNVPIIFSRFATCLPSTNTSLL